MAKEAESMTNQTQIDLMLKIRLRGESLKDNGLLAYHTELNEYSEDKGTFFIEQFEKDLVQMMELAYRYNNEVKELVK
jgi:hypothetical protein